MNGPWNGKLDLRKEKPEQVNYTEIRIKIHNSLLAAQL